MKAILKRQQGIALIMVIMVMALLLSITAAGLLFSGLNLRISGNYRMGTSAFHVADAGIQHALAVIPSGTTFGFSTDPDNPTSVVTTSLGTGTTYTVTAINTSGGTKAILTSEANDPNGTKKVIVGYIDRGTVGLGATNLPGSLADATETNFSGNSFTIDGNDNCNAAPSVPGIAVTDPDLATEITNDTTTDGGLESQQMDNVTGAGGTPSVATVPPLEMTVSELADAYLNHPTVPHVDLEGGNYGGNSNWGTSATPEITRITGDANIRGSVEGYGVLVVDGALDIAGNFTYYGLVIARGDIQVQVTGNAGIYGALVIGESTTQDGGYELDVRGNATLRYDSCALSVADGWEPLPKKAKLLAWQESLS